MKKKFKKLVATLVASTFLFSLAAPVSAATSTDAPKATVVVGKDVKGTKFEKPVAKLAALGVLNGKDNEGNVKPDDNITRAEFAKILVTELNMASGVTNASTKFKDVPSTHWASGYIALATGKGMIKGYPDGNFKPEAPVTYAEAATMVVRMLGYAPSVDEKAWPASYLSKAASIGVTDGVSVKAGDAAKRGDVFVMAANALDIDIMEQDDWGSETIYRVKEGKTILSEEFDITIMDEEWAKDSKKDLPVVDKTPRVALGTLESNEIEFSGLSGTYEVAPQIDPNLYLGEEVEVWVDEDDDYVYYLESSDDQEVIFDKIDDVSGGKIFLDKKDDDFDLLSGVYATKIWANIEGDYDYNTAGGGFTWNDTTLDGYTGARVKVVLDDNDDVTAMVITDFYPATGTPSAGETKSGLIKQVKVDDETIEYFKEGGGTDNIDLDDKDYAIIKDGAQAKLADLKANDIINVLTDNADEFYIVATSAKVEGKVEKVVTSDNSKVSSYDIYIGGKKYDISKQATLSEDANKSVETLDTDEVEDLDGMTVTAYLDGNGEVRHVSTGTVDGKKNAKVAVVTKGALYNPYDDTVTFEAVNEAGAELKFSFDADDVDLNNAEKEPQGTLDSWEALLNIDANPGVDNTGATDFKTIIIEYELNSAGKLADVDIVYSGNDNAEYKAASNATPDEDDDTLTVGNSSYNVVKDSVIFDVVNKTFVDAVGTATDTTTAAEIDDVKTTTWASVETKDSLGSVVYSLDEDEVDYLVVLAATGSLGSDGQYAVVKGFSTISGDDALVLLKADGKEETVKIQGETVTTYIYGRDGKNPGQTGATIKKGDFIRYETNSENEIDKVAILGYYNSTGARTATGDLAADLASLDLDVATMVNVTNSASTYIKGDVINGDGTVAATDATYTVNSNTKYLEIYDTDKLRTATGVSYDDLVLIIDTDDDGKTADFVVVLKENY